MIYGIDLGTTNSLIGYGDSVYTTLVKSSVNLEEECLSTDIVNDNVIESYKVDMTTGETGDKPRKASSVVLKELVRMANDTTGQNCNSVVVSVPAKFSHTQREAVKMAADAAGLRFMGLINEPTAAALYACQGTENTTIVYDLGGGTFDVSVVTAKGMDYTVLATDGLLIAGDNLDNAILNKYVKKFRVPIFKQTKAAKALAKQKCRAAKELLQKTKNSVNIEIEDFGISDILTVAEYKELLFEIFGSTIQLTNNICDRLGLNPEDSKILFVGGSTMDPYLKSLVMTETGYSAIEQNIPEDLLVAKGVALYAKLLEAGQAREKIKEITSSVSVGLSGGILQKVVTSGAQLPATGCVTLSNTEAGQHLRVSLYQGNNVLVSKEDYIGELIFEYNRPMAADEGVVNVYIDINIDGIITLTVEELETLFRKEIKIRSTLC